MITSYSYVITYVATYVCICDWICENRSKLYAQELKYILLPNIKAMYTLVLPRCTKHMAEDGHASLLSQKAFCQPCKTTEVHYRAYEASGWH